MSSSSQATTAMLRAIAAAWLRYDQRCDTILFERPDTVWGRPDVFGIRADGRATEIEIKVSVSDFKADAKKGKNQGYACPGSTPHLFYFIVPLDLVPKVRALMDSPQYKGKGLLSHHVTALNAWTSLPLVTVEKKPTRNPTAKSWAGYAPAGRDVSGTICSLAKEVAHLQSSGNTSLYKRIKRLNDLLWDVRWDISSCDSTCGHGSIRKRIIAELSLDSPDQTPTTHATGTLLLGTGRTGLYQTGQRTQRRRKTMNCNLQPKEKR